MSAVVAFAARAPTPIDLEWLEQATKLSCTSGSGSTGVWREGPCGLGHAPLTSDSDEDGPTTLDDRLRLTADVRLDARGDLCRALRTPGARLQDHPSDADLVLHAYDMWGEMFLERLAGDFAFALWDGRAQRLLCARDQLGLVPLHYVVQGDRLLVATDIDALLLHPGVGDALDESAISDFVAMGHYADRGATAFASIRRLPAGHTLTWAEGNVRVRRYWQLCEWEPLARFARPEEAQERFRELLDVAVADRLTTDRATVQLSGGMDSTSVAASALGEFRSRGLPTAALRAFTGVLGGDTGDREGEFATLVASDLGLPIDVLDASSFPAVDPFSTPALLTPEPTDYRPTDFELEYARLPARHAPVALSGHGGDALLMFVPWYWIEWLVRGRVVRLARACADRVRLEGGRPRPHVRAILNATADARRGRRPPSPPWLLSDHPVRGGGRTAARRRLPDPVRALDARSLASDPFWPALFLRGDPSFTREPVRFRYPLLDLRLVRFVRSLAPEPWLVDKRVLRDAASGRLPDRVRERRKTPLVRVPTSVPPTIHRALVELVRRSPELDRFLDPAALVAALGEESTSRRQRELGRALGLAHWLWHRNSVPIAERAHAVAKR